VAKPIIPQETQDADGYDIHTMTLPRETLCDCAQAPTIISKHQDATTMMMTMMATSHLNGLEPSQKENV
jgi:hypothetical protein